MSIYTQDEETIQDEIENGKKISLRSHLDACKKTRADERKAERKRIQNPASLHFRQHINLWGCGKQIFEKDEYNQFVLENGEKVKRLVRVNTNDLIERVLKGEAQVFYNSRGDAKKEYLNQLSCKDIDAHVNNRETFYYESRPFKNRRWSQYIYFMIDIDVLKPNGLMLGSIKGGKAFAKAIKKKFFHNSHIETSTSGKGTHVYVRLFVGSMRNKQINDFLQQLQTDLRVFHKITNADIEQVEIKGRCGYWTWMDGQKQNWTAGQLAKIPRKLEALPHESYTVADLSAITVEMSKYEIETAPVVIPEKKEEKEKVSLGNTTQKTKSSSNGAAFFDEQTVAELEVGGRFHDMAAQLLGTEVVKFANRRVLTPRLLAEHLMVGEFFTNHMNEDGSMPRARWQEMWTALYVSGVVQYSWSPNVWKDVRNWMTDKGLLIWEANEFEPPVFYDGKKHDGKACKWKFTTELMTMLEKKEEKEKVSLGNTTQKVMIEGVLYVGFRPEQLPTILKFHQIDESERQMKMEDYLRQEEALEKLFAA